ncbi:hypothetical protein SAMN05444920_108318 [Nonomuraea solani]|uniref:Uncharacterized protein n=1 Tax=Nonomuraea solani TaxID=1144553 RepID=A0A1H6EBE1_9ACTN|nr:hypothetical protein [Nonomuraea solani]SEG94244.1 hypothetical protein SAMN05444920_108318 [Nonomuraea solani]
MADVTRMSAGVPQGTRERLTARMTEEKAKRRHLLADPRWKVPGRAPAETRAAIRAEAHAHLRELREAGALCDTIDVLMTHAVRAELTDRGWDHSWPPPPPTAPRSGPWLGTAGHSWPERISVRLPSDLAERLYRACRHTSEPTLAALRAWRDDPLQYGRYREVADQVTTPGDILRDAIARALTNRAPVGRDHRRLLPLGVVGRARPGPIRDDDHA